MESSTKLPLWNQATSQRSPVSQEQLVHREFEEREFWRTIPAYREIDEATFMDHQWQMKHSVTHVDKLLELVSPLISDSFRRDAEQGFHLAPMSIRLSPYIISLIDWERALEDPLRLQFLPVQSQLKPNHPKLALDSLAEQSHSPVPGLVHRYQDKALFLALDRCPVYCRFCTRSYAVGLDTEQVDKLSFSPNESRWKDVFAYIASRPELEDIVISGGDVFQLRSQQIKEIGETLLDIPHVRRFRYASKGLSVMPQKILTDGAWVDALTSVVDTGRRMHKEVVLHTHFNHPKEISSITQRATNLLHERGVTLRNQSVLLGGVNDDPATMQLLVKRLAYINVHPYYVFMHDLVPGVEDLRTTLHTGISLEKSIRGLTAGFHTPTFVVDTQGGGGKRVVSSAEHYNKTTGISVFTSPVVHKGAYFFHFDPLHLLPKEGQARWNDPKEHAIMMSEALTNA